MINYSTSNNYIELDKNKFKTIAYVKNSPSSYSKTVVTLTIGRKKLLYLYILNQDYQLMEIIIMERCFT